MSESFKATLSGAEFVNKLKESGFTDRTIDALQEEDINSDAALKILEEPDIEALADKNKLTIGQKRLLLEFANTLRPKKKKSDDDRDGSRSQHSRAPPRGAKYQRTRSRSPLSDRRRHDGDRENPEKATCIGVFNLSTTTKEATLTDIFSRFGYVKDVKLVMDRITGDSRGFAFVYFADIETATQAKESCAGMSIDGKTIRTEYSITKRPHSPTPGAYLGKGTFDSSRSKRGRSERDQYEQAAYPTAAAYTDGFHDPYYGARYGGHAGPAAHGGHAPGPRHFY